MPATCESPEIRVGDRIRYPDAVVGCSPVSPKAATWVDEPVVVFEILSPGTTHENLVVNNAGYKAAPSIRRYVVPEQAHAAALVFARKSGEWVAGTLASRRPVRPDSRATS